MRLRQRCYEWQVLKDRLRAFPSDEKGVTAIEYALLAALIAIAVMGGAVALGGSLMVMWDGIAACVVDPASCA